MKSLENMQRLSSKEAVKCDTGLTLMSLPPELHLQIAQYLTFPDALSLKHSNKYFQSMVYTGIKLKIEWLIARRRLHLECPNNVKCDLGSDLRFCRGSVPLLMKRRRMHFECESRSGLGCLVYDTARCEHKKRKMGDWLRARLMVEVWWIVAALVAVLGVWMML